MYSGEADRPLELSVSNYLSQVFNFSAWICDCDIFLVYVDLNILFCIGLPLH